MIKTITFFKSGFFAIIFLYGLASSAQTILTFDNYNSGWGNWISRGDAFLANPTALDTNRHTFATNSKFRIRSEANNDTNDLFIDNIVIKGYPPAPDIQVF